MKRFGKFSCPLLADAPLAVFHFTYVVLRNAGHFGEPFLGQAFPVAVGPQRHFLFPADIRGKYFSNGIGTLIPRFKGFRLPTQLRNLAAVNAKGYGYKFISRVHFRVCPHI